ncbi:Zinc transporter ZIP9 [Frankliniella fusca]|uniref:Zinc transporter ZIP9 n=1 Tax=Frankliniella fusca TaxID=407009 RepID=A0AAE1GR46_9NEOP|nr:Zinc transporter ZIP9 [Frankliniella fusca]
MEEATMLLLLAIVMLVGSFVAGSIPLVMSMSEEKLQLISVLGAGLLVGTALAVIIPEGVRSLLDVPQVVQSQASVGKNEGLVVEEPHSHDQLSDIHSLIGLSLVLGFIFMLLIDQISMAKSRDIEGGGKGGERSFTATLGLVVHAAVDGVALGAAATTAHTDVEMIVFFAIMLHKAPAAFGLVTFLLHEGVDRKRIRKHLLIFSLAAPLLSLMTYFGIGQEGKDTLSSVNATGLAMLFSAGTFLYVATVHVLPELTNRNSGNCHGGGGGSLRFSELAALVVGSLLPALLTTGHHH